MKKKAIDQIIANFLLWLCVPIVLALIALIKDGNPETPFPKEAFLKLLEPSQLYIFLGAGAIYFVIFSYIRHKSNSISEQTRAFMFADLGLDEMGSALFGVGSILIVSLFLGAPLWHFAVGAGCYLFGYILKPDDTPLSTSTTQNPTP